MCNSHDRLNYLLLSITQVIVELSGNHPSREKLASQEKWLSLALQHEQRALSSV